MTVRLRSGRSSGRTALFLYVLLVVLPAVCFGLLLWRQLATDHQQRLSELPAECRDAADRLARAIATQVHLLREDEMSRPFEEFGERLYRTEIGADTGTQYPQVASPLARGPLREGVVGYFAYDATEIDPASPGIRTSREDFEVEVFSGLDADGAPRTLERAARAVAQRPFADGVARDVEDVLDLAQMEGFGQIRTVSVALAVLNLSQGEAEQCRQALVQHIGYFPERTHEVYYSYFDPERLDDVRQAGSPRPSIAFARTVAIEGIPALPVPTCIERITSPVMLRQGFVIDDDWLFGTLPASQAKSVLGPSLRLAGPGQVVPESEGVTVVDVDIFGRLGLASTGREGVIPTGVRVVTDTSELRREFREQNTWLLVMAVLLTVSMTIGIRLLLASIQRSRAEAERTRNFVASVTHELRTPIAAVKLYGEMLRDGWVDGEVRRKEYLGRIVSESDRLDGLVDRVLLRRRLYDGSVDEVVSGDLNAEITAQRSDLEMVGGRASDDIAFDLAEGLPPVLLTPEGVHVIVQNLVENARKYAPVERDADGRPIEPILVRTRIDGRNKVVLEVLDRGPGIPEKDRTRIFEAFLRLGDEHTRQAKGTGLGLHLVALQAHAFRGKVQALPRRGGGTKFQVTFRRA